MANRTSQTETLEGILRSGYVACLKIACETLGFPADNVALNYETTTNEAGVLNSQNLTLQFSHDQYDASANVQAAIVQEMFKMSVTKFNEQLLERISQE